MSNTAITMNGLLDAEYFDLDSKRVGDTFRIFVAKPPFVTGGKHPAIFVLDGNTLFTQVMDIQRTLAWGAETPAAYVIGVGYPTEGGFLQAISKRNRDYAPTDAGDYARIVLGSTAVPGAAAFLSFLSDELQPQLEARYAIDLDDTALTGVSLGGLFGVWVLLTGPSAFRRYILASPAIWWNNEEVWEWERRSAIGRQSLQAAVFVSAGGLEAGAVMREHARKIAENNPMLRPQIEATITWHDAHGWPRTVELTQELATKLRQRNLAGLRIHCHNMPDETHMSVSPAAISRGLRYVFDHWQP